MRLLVAASALALWAGTTLLLSRVRLFARRPLAERLRPYVPGGMGRPARTGLLSFASFADALAPAARAAGAWLAGLFGVSESLERRLRRLHAPLDATAFRLRQLGWCVAGAAGGLLAAVALRPPAPVWPLAVLGGGLLAFLVLEQRLAGASAARQRAVFLELPVVAEQIGMLLGAGYSLLAALDRIAQRGSGAVAADLGRAVRRVRQGTTEQAALREWAELADVDAVDRLVSVLALNREASDLGRLIAEEAQAIRREVHRELTETMERRSQQVWIPVTVATLLPGVVFIAVPFIEALSFFAD